ncbi:MAG: hypothetical protein HKN85_08680 [Gammaproteobacteria bacterium]|nr:hypothetical protein [Gammaproteobacteria bacterium]
MTRFAHSIWFFFAVGFALLASTATMLFLSEGRDDAGLLSLAVPALLLSIVLPALAAVLSFKLTSWRQPMLAWLIFCLIAAAVGGILLNPILN